MNIIVNKYCFTYQKKKMVRQTIIEALMNKDELLFVDLFLHFNLKSFTIEGFTIRCEL